MLLQSVCPWNGSLGQGHSMCQCVSVSVWVAAECLLALFVLAGKRLVGNAFLICANHGLTNTRSTCADWTCTFMLEGNSEFPPFCQKKKDKLDLSFQVKLKG